MKKVAVEVRIGKPIQVNHHTKENRKEFVTNIRDAVIQLHGSPIS